MKKWMDLKESKFLEFAKSFRNPWCNVITETSTCHVKATNVRSSSETNIINVTLKAFKSLPLLDGTNQAMGIVPTSCLADGNLDRALRRP